MRDTIRLRTWNCWRGTEAIPTKATRSGAIRSTSPSSAPPHWPARANGPLSIYTFISGGSTYPYKDLDGRSPVRIEQNSYYHNLVGNVLGFQGQTLLTYSGLGYNYTQTGWTYEALAADPGTVVPMWKIGFGACGPHGCPRGLLRP